MYRYMHIHTDIHTYIHTYIHTDIHTYISFFRATQHKSNPHNASRSVARSVRKKGTTMDPRQNSQGACVAPPSGPEANAKVGWSSKEQKHAQTSAVCLPCGVPRANLARI